MGTIDPTSSRPESGSGAVRGRPPTSRSAADPAAGQPGLLETVARRLREVSESLNAATGGAALCRIDGTGGSAKSLEGRAAALQAARRALRRGGEEDAVLDDLLQRWRQDLAKRTDSGAGAAWLDYLSAAVAELEHLRATSDARHARPAGAVGQSPGGS